VAGDEAPDLVVGGGDEGIFLIPGRFLEAPFRRGDASGNGRINIADPIWILTTLYQSGPETSCLDAADADDNGQLELTDALYLLGYIFSGGKVPPPPFQVCREDFTPDDLGCLVFPPCE
jgi:hypothetical protein